MSSSQLHFGLGSFTENGLRIVAWSKPRMFCKESLGKIKFRAFPKHVGLGILSLENVDYFGTSEHYWVVERK